MKHLKLFFALFAMLALGVGNAWGAETLYKNALFKIANCTKNSSYTGKVTCTIGDDSWVAQNAANNNGGWDYVKIGAKKSKSSDPTKVTTGTITTDAAYAEAVSKIVVNGKKDRGSFTSKLIIASNSSFTTDKVEITGATSFTNNQIVFEIASPSANKYYKLEFVCSNTTTTNGVIQVSSVEYYYEPSSEETAVSVPTFSVPEGTFYSPINVELSCSTADAEIHYTLDGSTPTSTSEKYTTAIAISETTTVKAIAVKDGLTDSEVAAATYTKGETVTSYDIDFETNALEAYVNWDFSNIAVATTTITAEAGTYYGNTCGKASASIKTKTAIQYPGTLTFHTSKETGNTTSSNWIVQVSENGSTWTEVTSFDATTGSKGTWTERTADLSDYENVYVQISYSGSTAIRAIDEISLAQGVAPVKYTLNITTPTNGTLVVNEGETEVTSGATFKKGTTLTITATPSTGYKLDGVTVVDESSNNVTADVYADGVLTMPAYNVTISAAFSVNEKPDATLTLSKNGVTEDITGYKQDDKVTLPSITSDCVKEFVGWSADANCATEPEYKAGAEYTLAKTAQTLYAVYADAVGGEPTWNRVTNLAALTSGGTFILGYEATAKSGEIIPMRTSGTATTSTAGYMYSGNADGTTSNNATLDMASISESSKFEIVLEASSIVDGAVNIKLGDNYLGNTDTKNNCKLFTSASINTAFTPTIGTNDVITLTIEANDTYTTLQFNSNSGSYRYAVYGGAQKDVVFYKKEITSSYSNYSTTCAAAPIATVNPTSVTAPAAGVNGTLEASYENVNTENVAVALFNDEACTEAFIAGWLTASIDADKNIAYTVAENTTYAERKAYIQLTAPETTAAVDPAVVVIPVTQAGKDKVFASLAELVAADLTAGDEVTVTLNNDVIKDFYINSSKRCGVVFDVQKDGKDIKIYFNNQTTIDDWAVGGKLSGTLTNVKWTTYSSAWQLAPDYNTWAWANLTYTEPKAVSTVVVSGAPTKTTYVDGEAFDPAGLTVTVNYNDATTEVNPTGVTFAVTPTTLVKGQTSVSVTATFNSVTSAAYEVTDLTVYDIPTKTVAEFIAAGGTRCYLEGIVSNITNTTYGNFDLTDASGKIYVYGCLNAAGESKKFADLGVKNGDKIKVIADQFKVYGGKDQATDVQYVSHISAATITIADITMEVGETHTILASVEPVADVTYTIKENTDNAISLDGNTITALAEGTATITATVEEGATYLGNSVDFTVTVGPKTESEEVVILAELGGKWYAMKGEKASGTAQMAALEVTYFNGTLYNVADADKASITWTRTVVGDKVTFANNGKYLKGTSGDTNLALDGSKCEWTFNGTTYTIGNRTFLYRENFNFKNYTTDKADAPDAQGNYSALPVVTAPVYATGDIVYTRTVTNGNYGTLCIPFGSNVGNFSGAKFYEVSWLKEGEGLYLDELAAGDALVAGKPYIFRATSTEIKVTCTGAAVAEPVPGANGLTGTFDNIAANTDLVGHYIIAQNKIWVAGEETTLPANRAYINATLVPKTEQAKLPGRRRVCMGENAETGVDNIITTDAPVKVIENGQLIIIRNGEKFNVQGQKL